MFAIIWLGSSSKQLTISILLNRGILLWNHRKTSRRSAKPDSDVAKIFRRRAAGWQASPSMATWRHFSLPWWNLRPWRQKMASRSIESFFSSPAFACFCQLCWRLVQNTPCMYICWQIALPHSPTSSSLCWPATPPSRTRWIFPRDCIPGKFIGVAATSLTIVRK